MDPSSTTMSNKLLLLTGGQADKIEGTDFRKLHVEPGRFGRRRPSMLLSALRTVYI